MKVEKRAISNWVVACECGGGRLLTQEQVLRYARNIAVDVIGTKGQEALLGAKVLVVGAGGLGSPVCLYLAAAGVGTLGVLDADRVELGNLQRQILHRMTDIGAPKVDSAAREIAGMNPDVTVNRIPTRLDAQNVMGLVSPYDVVVSCVDNLGSRYVLNDACVRLAKPLVEAGVARLDGLLFTIAPHKGPCYRCLFPEEPPPGVIPSTARVGIVGAVAGAMGCLQALEVIKIVTGAGAPLVGRALLFDGLDASFREIRVSSDPDCPACGSGRTRRTPLPGG